MQAGRVARYAFALLTAAGLTFGAATATASPEAKRSCIGGYGTCTSTPACDSRCKSLCGPQAFGDCVEGCCLCNC